MKFAEIFFLRVFKVAEHKYRDLNASLGTWGTELTLQTSHSGVENFKVDKFIA